MTETILTPVLILIVWTLIVLIWMYATRVPAMAAHKVDPQSAQHPGEMAGALPSSVRRIADNYNHLHEQPVLFYALVFYIHLAGASDTFMIWLAWAYVAIRILHSLIQCLWNRVVVRFGIFVLGSLVLIAMAVRALLGVL